MPNWRNFTASDQGVNWNISEEFEEPQGSGTWQLIEVSLPADLDELPSPSGDNYGFTIEALHGVVEAIGRQRGLFE
jgi:hypothetical protein